jgi:hypothetical protein
MVCEGMHAYVPRTLSGIGVVLQMVVSKSGWRDDCERVKCVWVEDTMSGKQTLPYGIVVFHYLLFLTPKT